MYTLYYKLDRLKDKAPSKISINKDYEAVAEVEAAARSEAVRKWYRGEIEMNSDAKIRPPAVGDVVKDPAGVFFILTHSGIWASVTIL